MKKIIYMIIILLTACLMILLLAFGKSKLNKKYDLIKYDDAIVDIVDNKAVSDIQQKSIKITNIYFEGTTLNCDIIGDKEKIMSKTFSVVVYNDFAKNPGNILYVQMTDFEKELTELSNGYNVKMNLDKSYNNPYRIKIELK